MRPISLALLLTLGLASCSESPDATVELDRALSRGDLEAAEALLTGLDASTADLFRRRIEASRGERAKALARVDGVLEGVRDRTRIVVQRQLEELRQGSRDPVVRTRIDTELSGLVERYRRLKRAESEAARPEPAAERAPKVAAAEEPAAPAERSLRGTTAWNPYPDATPASLDAAPEREPTPAAPPEPIVVAQPEPEPEPEREPEPAPPEEAAEVADFEPTSFPATVDRLLRDAHEHALVEDLAAARDTLLEVASRARFGPERDGFVGKARDLEDRRLLRVQLVESYAADRTAFRARGFDAVDAQGVATGGERIAWSELDLDQLLALTDGEPLSLRSRLGRIQEQLVRGGTEGAWRDLSRLQKDGLVDAELVGGVVSRFRGEPVPPGGYVFEKGGWIAGAELDERERGERLAKLEQRFLKADASELDGLVAEYRTDDAAGELAAALALRWTQLTEELAKDRTARRIEKLAEARRELDRRREEALALIFDEETYFYPYNPPECPPEKAKEYPAAQRRVDVLVGAVRDAWRDQESVALAKPFRRLVDEVEWSLALREELASELDESLLPSWLAGVDRGLDEVALADFAWDAKEAEDLRYSRAVLAYNARRWGEEETHADGVLEAEPDATPVGSERKQVDITNEYRLMFGRRALAWNPKIQAAAADHSDYMSRTGDFGHFEPDPETKTPGDRMRRRGYTMGASENCHAGGGDPMGAHVGWLHSSGHHRNILVEGHREMASALSGRYWTQNFGAGWKFEAELDRWRD
ncbi:MAG: CAP domain-containing protein [Planctomycetota bacterium]